MTFTVEIDQNPYLPEGAGQVDAIVTVTAAGLGATAVTTDAVVVLVVDCSASMGGTKIRAAQQATAVAIDALRDGVAFAVVAGTHHSFPVYPEVGTARAGARTRAEAKAVVGRLRAGGGTAIGAWLRHVLALVQDHPDAIRHAVLLTDGQNGEDPRVLAAAVDACTGAFTCDCRGVGTDWRVDELRKVASALLGSVDIVADAAHLADDFADVLATAMGKGLADVALRLWTPKGAAVRLVKQVAPVVADLTDRRAGEPGGQRGDYPLGTWGDETREYHLRVDVAPQAAGAEMLASRVSLVQGADVLGQGLVKALWTTDSALSTRISRGVAHYTGQAELAEAIQEGLAARKAGDEPRATARLGRAVALAAESGNEGTARLLARVVDVLDAPTGTVRLRPVVDDADEMTLDTRSTRTVRVRGDGS